MLAWILLRSAGVRLAAPIYLQAFALVGGVWRWRKIRLVVHNRFDELTSDHLLDRGMCDTRITFCRGAIRPEARLPLD
jgi:hypothetical protein